MLKVRTALLTTTALVLGSAAVWAQSIDAGGNSQTTRSGDVSATSTEWVIGDTGTGSVTMDGSSEDLESVFVGNSNGGIGTLTLENGAVLTLFQSTRDSDFFIGNLAGSEGTVIVDSGTINHYSSGNSAFVIGNSGVGNLAIENRGAVTYDGTNATNAGITVFRLLAVSGG